VIGRKSKGKSDAMRSSAIRMSDDPIEAVAFFMNVELDPPLTE